jgi:hypothetical protein
MDNKKAPYELYFPTLNINTYNCIIGARCLSLLMSWTYVMCFKIKHYNCQFQQAQNNIILQWTLVKKIIPSTN